MDTGDTEREMLREARRAFREGAYGRARVLCARLERGADPDVARAARALRRRSGVDPAQVGGVLLSLVAAAVIMYIYVL